MELLFLVRFYIFRLNTVLINMYSHSNGRVLSEYECLLISFAFMRIRRQMFFIKNRQHVRMRLPSHSSGEAQQ